MKRASIALVLLSAATVGWSQVSTGSLGGQVADPNGSAVPAAKVVARNDATGQEYATVTSEFRIVCFPDAEHRRV